MTKVFVFDTNCIISAHLLPASLTRKAYDIAWKQGVLVYSKDTFSEFVQTFAKEKFDKYVSIDKRTEAITAFENRGFLIDISMQINVCRDPKDNKFLELALTAKADYIVTGDKDLLVLHPFYNIPIVTLGDFHRFICDE